MPWRSGRRPRSRRGRKAGRGTAGRRGGVLYEQRARIASVKKGFALKVRRAGLDDVHPHDLRRTFGSWLVQAGVDIRRVSELMRHSDIRVTASVYAHVAPGDLVDAVEVLDRTPKGVTVSRCPKRARREGRNRRQPN